MTTQPDQESLRSGVREKRGSFDFLSLTVFSDENDYLHIFKSQHSEILAGLNMLMEVIKDNTMQITARSLTARCNLSELFGNLCLHQSQKSIHLLKPLAKDARYRAIASQFDRDFDGLRSTFSDILKAFPAPSHIVKNTVEFIGMLENLVKMVEAEFKEEERELFPLIERIRGQ